jgi:lysophospholipase L1-like esterase
MRFAGWSLGRVVAVGIVLGALCVGAAGVAEILMRRVPRLMPPQKQLLEFVLHSPFRATVSDPDVGFLPRPNQHEQIRTVDYAGLYVTDSHGFPNREPWPAHPDLVFLGDSLAFGYGVSLDEAFAPLAAHLLGREEVNLALAASGPRRQDAVFRKWGEPLHAPVVVSALFLASDVDNDFHFESWLSRGRPANYDEFRLTLAREQHDTRVSWLEHTLERSWLYADAREALLDIVAPDRVLRDRYRFADGSEILLSYQAERFAATPVRADDPRLDDLVGSLDAMRTDVERAGGTLLVVLVPSKEELFAVPRAATASNFVARARSRLDEAGFPVLDLYPVVRDAGRDRSPYFRTDSHFNAAGNRVVAGAIASRIRELERHATPSAHPPAPQARR